MINNVVKRDGRLVPFDPDKLNKWAEYASRQGVPWSTLAQETYKRLSEGCSTEDIHDTMIKVCLSKEDINWSRVAGRLEFANIRSGMKRVLGLDDRSTFKEIFDTLIAFGYWDEDSLPSYDPEWENWYKDIYDNRLEYWQVKQWSDKYAIKESEYIIETPHIGAMGLALAIHGNTTMAYGLAKSIITGKINQPTPVLNGCRNGDFNGISCCVISGDDSVESIEVAQHIAVRMTAKKAGIGIEFTTRTKNDNVKGGRVKHLGKSPIYAALDKGVKMFTQITRGGSATTTFNCIDPEIESLLMLKSQRTPENARIDKLDYSFAYNDAFLQAVVFNEDWNLYSYLNAPEVYENFHLPAEEYNAICAKNKPAATIKARKLLAQFLQVRGETGRVYCINLTRANTHTPFLDPIKLSNLCQEICLPTKPYPNMEDLYSAKSEGETAFCSLAAINVAKVELEEYRDIAKIAVYTLNKLIEKAPMMTRSMKESIMRRRSIGVGITGLAGALYAKGFDYDMEEAKPYISKLSEYHYYYMLKASQDYAMDYAVQCDGIDNNWMPIDTRISTFPLHLDWEALRGKPRANSVLVAHMPTESSAVFSDATNGLYPVRQRIVEKLSRKGKVQYLAPSGNYKLAWEHDNNDLSKVYAIVQDFTDQAISADYYVVPANFPGKKVPMSVLMKEWIIQAKAGNKTMYYLNTNDYTGGSFQQQMELPGTDCDGCKL